jgi:hypothetical protein
MEIGEVFDAVANNVFTHAAIAPLRDNLFAAWARITCAVAILSRNENISKENLEIETESMSKDAMGDGEDRLEVARILIEICATMARDDSRFSPEEYKGE